MRLAGRSSAYLILIFLSLTAAASFAQTMPAATADTAPKPAISSAPTSADVMRERINKAKAYLAVRNYNAAIFELENIRRESADASVQSVTSVLLMNSYLEKGDYRKAQDLLTASFNEQKTTKPNAFISYAAVAGQIAKVTRSVSERYRSFGISASDRSLPIEVLSDLEKMRELLETVITQIREISAEPGKASTAFGLLEEMTAARASIARDDYDAKRWREAVADWREQMASSRSVVVNAMDGSTEMPISGNPADSSLTISQKKSEVNEAKTFSKSTTEAPAPASVTTPNTATGPAAAASPASTPDTGRPRTIEKSETNKADTGKATTDSNSAVNSNNPTANKAKDPNSAKDKPAGPVAVGSLMPYATRQVQPVYPPAARSTRTAGVVRVELLIDENGEIEQIRSVTGPTLLQESAKDAVRKWKFRPMIIESQTVKIIGFVSFNFSL